MTISKKCKKIKLLITDVDGVLTDGGMYYSEKGEVLKKFNTKDGMGVEILRNHGIKTVFLTKENSKIARLRGKKVNVDGVYVNIAFKDEFIEYTSFIFVGFMGYLFFNEIPSNSVIIGGILIIISGIYVAYRERKNDY